MDINEMVDKLKGNPELAASLKEAFGKNADAKEISDILSGAGVDAETAETLVSEYQCKRGASISAQSLDDEALDQVAGGGSGLECSQAEDCDKHYTSEWYWKRERCEYQSYCDEYWHCARDFDLLD